MELYKKHRPDTFDRVIGNSDTVTALKNMIERKTLPHSILFSGPSGAGKTTLARILQAQLGCHPMDLWELNSSSYRGIDSIRDVARVMNLAPVGECRVFIMDECHKLTNDAQNAALKMLEDTPSQVYFFLCTTDPERLIKPIRTRCMSMPVRALDYDELMKLLERVVKKEGIDISEQHADEMVAACEGSARTLLVMLEKVASLPEEERSEAIKNRIADEGQAMDLCRALIKRDPWKKVARVLREMAIEDCESIRWSVLGYARAVILNEKGDGETQKQAFFVVQAFSRPFYDSKEAGLAAACYEAVIGV